jgi:hypothetical protein
MKDLEVDYPSIDTINIIIDVIYLIDIIAHFRTTEFHSSTGEEITDSKMLAKRYLKGRFFIDLMSSVPFEKISAYFYEAENAERSKKYVLISCIKLIRVLRLTRFIDYLRASDTTKLNLKVLKMMFFLVLYIHMSSCFWFYICYFQYDHNHSCFKAEPAA